MPIFLYSAKLTHLSAKLADLKYWAFVLLCGSVIFISSRTFDLDQSPTSQRVMKRRATTKQLRQHHGGQRTRHVS